MAQLFWKDLRTQKTEMQIAAVRLESQKFALLENAHLCRNQFTLGQITKTNFKQLVC